VKRWIYFYDCPCLGLEFFSFNHLPTIVVNENPVRILGSRHAWKMLGESHSKIKHKNVIQGRRFFKCLKIFKPF
jgi:hypothetical protein